MSHNHQTKAIGKAIVIVLLMAIVFFLLLPFLDNPSASGTQKNKKAVAQIFTSNPLTDLVRKVYAMFRGNRPADPAQTAGQYAYANQELFQTDDAQRAATTHPGNGQTASVDTQFNYNEDAELINENGEWILVRQTIPDAAQQGMHDISSKESAYDRLIRQERAAKYTGKSTDRSGPEIPDSKWTKLWKPIKQFFGMVEDSQGDPISADGMPQRFALASADGSGLGQYAPKQAGIGRARSSSYGQTPGFSANNPDGLFSVADLLDPDYVLNQTTENLLKGAKDILSSKQYEKAEKRMRKITREEIARVNREYANSLLEEVGDRKPENLINKTFLSSCQSGGGGLYDSAPDNNKACGIEITDANKRDLHQQNLQKIKDALNIPHNKEIKMMTVMGLARDFDPVINENNEEAKLIAQYYQHLLEENNCDEQDCVWVAQEREKGRLESKHLSDSIEAAGFVPTGYKETDAVYNDLIFEIEKRLENTQEIIDIEMELDEAKAELEDAEDEDSILNFYTEEEKEELRQRIKDLEEQEQKVQENYDARQKKLEKALKDLEKGYYPIPADKWREIARGSSPREKPYLLGDSAIMASLIKKGLIDAPARIITDPDGRILDLAQTTGNIERADYISKQALQNIAKRKEILNQSQQNISQEYISMVTPLIIQNEQDKLKQSAKQTAEDIMGL